MGGSIGSDIPSSAATFFAFQVVRDTYESYKQFLLQAGDDCGDGQTIEDAPPSSSSQLMSQSNSKIQRLLERAYKNALEEKDVPIEQCKYPAVLIFKYKLLNEEEQKQFQENVIVSALEKEKAISTRKKSNSAEDYSKSFGGTAADSKNEKEAAAILRGEDGGGNNADSSEEVNSFLCPPHIESSAEQRLLREIGPWKKFLGSSGCFLYINTLSREVVSLRPEAYEDEDTERGVGGGIDGEGAQRDPANGLPRVDAADVPAEAERIIKELGKTPLFLDCSVEQVIRTYYSYKGSVADVSSMTVPFGKSGVKKEAIMERCRGKLVAALKTGSALAFYLGEVGIEHADIKGKLCKKDVFPKETFQGGGGKLLQPDYEPRYKKVFREADLEAGQAVARDGFQVVVISSMDPYVYEAALGDCIPLGYMVPVYVNPP